jgi:hypothetical protein
MIALLVIAGNACDAGRAARSLNAAGLFQGRCVTVFTTKVQGNSSDQQSMWDLELPCYVGCQ